MNKMKCCIFTLCGGDNYGAELQNYAVQHILKNVGCYGETFFKQSYMGRRLSLIRIIVRDIIKRILGKSYGKYYARQYKFEVFRKRYINKSKYHVKNLKDINKAYDFVLVGSDQVWNPLYNSFEETMMLDFADNDKKIAFCASMGVEEIPSDKIKIFEKNIPLFRGISVREKQAEYILQPFTNKKIVTLCDPTIMVQKKEWENIATKPEKHLYKDYILVYFLGDIDDEKRKKVHKIAKEKNCSIVDVSPYASNRIDRKDSSYYDIGPLEFVWLIFNSQLVCTDSFHGLVFSCIGERNAIIFQRTDKLNMESRIKNLLDELGQDFEYEKELHIDKMSFESYSRNKLCAAEDFLRQNIRK